MLAALYTDSSANSPLGKIARFLGKSAPARIQRLARREIRGVPEGKIYSSDALVYRDMIRRLAKIDYTEYDQWCHVLSEKMITWSTNASLPHIDIIYNMFCENLEFIRYAKQHMKTTIVSDIYAHPFGDVIVANEAQRLGLDYVRAKGIQNIDIQYIKETCDLSDVLLCPSQFVADGVLGIDSAYADKILICPYGSSIEYDHGEMQPKRGQVFWAGGDWVRKGLHVVAAAADTLKVKYPSMRFRVAGITDEAVIRMARFRNLEFVGKLNYEEMKSEFLNADCFVLPSFSEGMAGVVVEALAAGCPVITTKASGIDGLLDGINGFVVPEGNAEEVARRIEILYENREVRTEISKQALNLSKSYTMDSWQQRLVNALLDIMEGANGTTTPISG